MLMQSIQSNSIGLQGTAFKRLCQSSRGAKWQAIKTAALNPRWAIFIYCRPRCAHAAGESEAGRICS